MMVDAVSTASPEDVSALKAVALDVGLVGETKLSSGNLAKRLDISRQTAARRLKSLDAGGLITRDVVTDGQWISITATGERTLRQEYEAYRHLFDQERRLEMSGKITSGMGEGQHYISLHGYTTQFRDRLGYEPFAGTLNVELSAEAVRQRSVLYARDPIAIDGWEDDDRTYGPASVYPATVETASESYERVHIIEPERTHHDETQLELLAPDKLREALDLADGQEVTVYVG